MRQLRLQICFYRPRQNGCSPFCADGDGHGIAVHDSGCDELAGLKVVDDIHQRAIRAGQPCCAGIQCVVLISRIGQCGTQRITGGHRAALQTQLARGSPGFDLRVRLGCEDGQMCGAFEQKPQLGQRGLSATAEHDTASCKGKKDGEMIHRALRGAVICVGCNIEKCPDKLLHTGR